MDDNLPQQSLPQPNQNSIYQKASFWQRLIAYIVDGLLVSIFLIIFFIIFKSISSYLEIICFIVISLYGTIFIWARGSTPGKMLLKLKVVTSSYKPVGFWHALLREGIGKPLSGLLSDLGYCWVLIDKNKQAWHDKLAHTFVLKLDKNGNFITIPSEDSVTVRRKVSFSFIYLVLCFPIIFLIIYIFFFRPFQVVGYAMYPNYQNNEYMLTNLISLRFNLPKRGDVIIFQAPPDPQKDFIKRVIGLEGDTIMVKDGSVYINGQLLNENAYLKPNVKTYGSSFLHDGDSVIVPTGHLFVMGDNRAYSSDSREWGFVPIQYVISKVAFCYWNCSVNTK